MEDIGVVNIEESEIMKTINGKQTLKRKLSQYYDKQQQMELVLAAQELFEFGDHDLGCTDSDEEEKCWMDTKDIDIWKNTTRMELLREGILLDVVEFNKSKRTRKRIMNYH
jgi:hypothetical protein